MSTGRLFRGSNPKGQRTGSEIVPGRPSGGGLLAPELAAPSARTHTGQRQDPYLTWAGQTDLRYLAGGTEGSIRLAGVLRGGHSLVDVIGAVNVSGTNFSARSILDTKYFTARMTPPTNAACHALLHHADFVLAEPGMRPVGRSAPADPARAARGASPARPRGRSGSIHSAGVVIGVIDGLCGFANERFCRGASSALDLYWDQGGEPDQALRSSKKSHWSRPSGMGYGRELRRDALDQFAAGLSKAGTSAGPRADAERELYRVLGHKVPDDADWSHGTHVLDTVLSDVASASGAGAGKRPGVIYVQLPEQALLDTSARWAAAYVLDAIDYVVTRSPAQAQVVINLSLGAFAGPHDGSSLLERAVDEIIQRLDGRLTVVVAAGNAGLIADDGTGVRKSCHARVALEPAGKSTADADLTSASFVWDIDALDATESFLELWVPDMSIDADECGISVSLRHEMLGSLKLEAVAPDTTGTISRGGSVIASVVNATGACTVPNGSGGMALIALAHTRDQGTPAAPAGRWFICVTNECSRPVTVDAWIERRDIPGELAGFRPQYGFVEQRHFRALNGSLGTLANGRRTVVVGALAQESASASYTVSDYSSEGLESSSDDCNARVVSRGGPDIYSAGRRTASGFFSGTTKSLAGTSMAAAQVSAAVASVAALPIKADETMLDRLRGFAAHRQAQSDRIGRSDPQSPNHPADPASAPRLGSLGRDRSRFVLPPSTGRLD